MKGGLLGEVVRVVVVHVLAPAVGDELWGGETERKITRAKLPIQLLGFKRPLFSLGNQYRDDAVAQKDCNLRAEISRELRLKRFFHSKERDEAGRISEFPSFRDFYLLPYKPSCSSLSPFSSTLKAPGPFLLEIKVRASFSSTFGKHAKVSKSGLSFFVASNGSFVPQEVFLFASSTLICPLRETERGI